MINLGVPNKTISAKHEQLIFNAQYKHWECQICGTTEKPQDYINMERHIWRRNGKQKRHEAANNMEKQTPLTLEQEKRINALMLPEQQAKDGQYRYVHDPEIHETHNHHIKRNDPENSKPIWEQISLVKWDPEHNQWKSNIDNCTKNDKNVNKPNQTPGPGTQK